MILLLHKIDILTNKTFIEERNIRIKVTKFSSHDEITHFDGMYTIRYVKICEFKYVMFMMICRTIKREL